MELRRTYVNSIMTTNADTSVLDGSFVMQGQQYAKEMEGLTVRQIRSKQNGHKMHITTDKAKLTELIKRASQMAAGDSAEYRLVQATWVRLKSRYNWLEASYDVLEEKLRAVEPVDTEASTRYQTEWNTMYNDRASLERSVVQLQVEKESKKMMEETQYSSELNAQHEKEIMEQRMEKEKELKEEFRNRDGIKKALKMPTLTKDFTLSDFDNWKKTLRVYWKLNDMSSMSQTAQMEIFLSFLATELKTEVRSRVEDDTEVMESSFGISCMDVLNDMFRVFHPIFACRAAYFTMRRKDGESGGHFLARLKQAQKQAQVEKMKPDDISAHLAHAHIRIEALEDKWNRKPELTLAELTEYVANWDRAHNISTTVKNTNANVNAASLSPGNRNAYQKDRAPQPPGQGGAGGDGFQCYRCGGNHLKRDCTKKYNEVMCGYCKIKGHHIGACNRRPGSRPARPAPQPPRGAPRPAQNNNVDQQPQQQQPPQQQQLPESVGMNSNVQQASADMVVAQAAAAAAAAYEPFAGPATVPRLRDSLPTPRLQM